MSQVLLKSPPELDFVSADLLPAIAHLDLAAREVHLTQPDGTQTEVTVTPAAWRDDGGSPLQTITFLGTDAGGIQLSGALLYWEGVPRLHIDRIPPALRADDYRLTSFATDTYSGVNAECRPVTVTLLDPVTRTVQIAEFDYPTVTYNIAAEDWLEEVLGGYQSTRYAIEDGALTINGGFLVGEDSLGWLQTREYAPPDRAGDYNLGLTAPDTYSGSDAHGNTATVTLLDLTTRTVQIAEQGYPTGIYSVPAEDWIEATVGEFQSITYAIEDGALQIHGGFLTGDESLAWLQTREGAGRADSYDTAVVWQVMTLTIAPQPPALAVAATPPVVKIARAAPALTVAAARTTLQAARLMPACKLAADAPRLQATPAAPALAAAATTPGAQIFATTPRLVIERSDSPCPC